MTGDEINIIRNRGQIRIGSLVMVAYPMNEQTNNPARKFDGQTFTVESMSTVRIRQGTIKKMFSLDGAKSDADMPFWFLEEELIAL